jgi:hypothetical protein
MNTANAPDKAGETDETETARGVDSNSIEIIGFCGWVTVSNR